MTRAAREAASVARAYDRRMARWRAIVDWAKGKPWALRLVNPLSRGRGRFRFIDRFTSHLTPAAVRPDPAPWNADTLAATWLGHATVLLRVGTTTILTDPVFSTRVGLGWGFGTLGPARFVAPALDVRDLPPIDLVLVSHAHFDHLDRPTLARLARRSTTVVCAAGTGDLLDDLGFREVIELPLGESVRASGVTATAIPTRHWGARMVLDNARGHCAMLVEGTAAGRPTRVLYGGDSAYTDAWRPVGAGGGVDLAIVGIGAYDPWIEGHANPEQAWQMAADHARARHVLAMHHSTFKLSQEPMDEPLRRFLIAARSRANDIVCRRIGETWVDH